MQRRMRIQIVTAAAVLLGGILWLLSAVAKESFGWFNFALFVVVVSFIWGLTLFVDALTSKAANSLKKAKVVLGIILMVLAGVCLYWGLALPTELVLPLVVIIIACGSFVVILATKGDKWDKGDNEVEGYKTYRERKAEEEKQKAEQEQNNKDNDA